MFTEKSKSYSRKRWNLYSILPKNRSEVKAFYEFVKTKEQIEKAIKKAIRGTSDLFQIRAIEDKQTVQRQIGPGKPGPKTRYKEQETISYRLKWELDHRFIADLVVRDGIFPLITNFALQAADVLKAYRNYFFKVVRLS